MSFKKKMYGIVAAATVIITLLTFSLTASAAGGHSAYPESLGGLPVVFVQTSENTANLPQDKTVLILLDNASSSPGDAMARLEASDDASWKALPEGWSINVIGGPDASKNSYEQLHKKDQETTKGRGPIKLRSVPAVTPDNSISYAANQPTSYNTHSIVRTKDPSSETITYISARWASPTVGDEQNTYSALLVNGMTNLWYSGDWFFLQSGQTYEAYIPGELSLGYNSWADSSVGLVAQHFANVPYYNNHTMQFTVAQTYSGWYMSAQDITSSNFEAHLETVATGGNLQSNWNTSIFFENNNENADWYDGFTEDIEVYDALDGIGVPVDIHDWNDDERGASDGHGILYINHDSVTGSLKDSGTATFHLDEVLLWTDD